MICADAASASRVLLSVASPFLFFFFNDTATTEIYPLSLHDALPISQWEHSRRGVYCGTVGLASPVAGCNIRSEEHTSELQSPIHLVCRLLLEKIKTSDLIQQSFGCADAPTSIPASAEEWGKILGSFILTIFFNDTAPTEIYTLSLHDALPISVSVIVQVVSFKLTGKRVFKMAPLHHHFEQLGWTEPQIGIRFWIVAVVLVP